MKKDSEKVMKLVRKTPRKTMTLTKKANKMILKKKPVQKKETPQQRAPKKNVRKMG